MATLRNSGVSATAITMLSSSSSSSSSSSPSQLLLCKVLGRLWPIQCSVHALKNLYERYPNCFSERGCGFRTKYKKRYSTTSPSVRNSLGNKNNTDHSRRFGKTDNDTDNNVYDEDDDEDDDFSLYCPESEPLLPIQYAILGFARRGLPIDLTQYILSHHPEHINSTTASGYTLLQLAIISGGRAYRAGCKTTTMSTSINDFPSTTTTSTTGQQVQYYTQQSLRYDDTTLRLNIIRFLIHLHPKIVSKPNPITGETALHLALTECDSEVVDLLLSIDPSLIRIPKPIPAAKLIQRTSSNAAIASMPLLGNDESNKIPKTSRPRDVSFPLFPLHIALLDSAFIDTDCIIRMVKLDPKACAIAVTKRMLYPIHLATLRRFTTVVQCMIRCNPDSIQYQDSKRNTALHFVRDPATAKVLVKYCPDAAFLPNSDRKQLPIHRACRSCCMIPNGNTMSLDISTRDTSNHRVKYWNSRSCRDHSLASFSIIQMVQVIDELVNIAPTSIRIPDSDGNLPLHILVEQCGSLLDYEAEHLNPIIDKFIYEYPKALFKSSHRTGNLPLHIAAGRLSPHSILSIDSVRKLLELHPESARKKNSDGYLPFHLAVMNVVKRSKSLRANTHMNDNYIDNDNDRTGRRGVDATIQLIRDMIESYPQCLYRQDSIGRLPVHILLDEVCQASWNENESSALFLQCLRLMVEKCSKALKCVDSKGRLPLHVAIEQLNNMVVVGQRRSSHASGLLEDDTDSDDDDDSEGGNDSMYTFQKRLRWSESVCDFLLNEYPDAAEVADCCGRLPLHVIVVGASDDSITYNSVKSLVDIYPKGMSTARIDGNLPLHAAIIHGASDSVIKLLATRGPIALSRYNMHGYTPIHLACFHRPSVSIIQPLLRLSPSSWKQQSIAEKLPALFFACSADASLDVILLLTHYSIDLIISAARTHSESNVINTHLRESQKVRDVLKSKKSREEVESSSRRKSITLTSRSNNSYTHYRNKVYKFVNDIEWIPSVSNSRSDSPPSSFGKATDYPCTYCPPSVPVLPELYHPRRSFEGGSRHGIKSSLSHKVPSHRGILKKSTFIAPPSVHELVNNNRLMTRRHDDDTTSNRESSTRSLPQYL